MRTAQIHFLCTVCAFVVVIFARFGHAESVYVVNHSSAVISFDVNGDELVFRNELFLPAYGYGGIDLAIDNDYNILFMSSEATNVFEIIDAHTLTHIKSETFSGPGNITGLVYDAAESRILATERNTNILYSILWDPARQELTVEQPYIYLDHITHACDVAINGDVLYVSEYYYNWSGILPSYEKIYAYDIADDFAYLGMIDLGAPVVSIDYNYADNSIYAGCWQGYDYDYIIKYDMDPNVVITKDISANVVGMSASNSVAGRVFVTTFRNGGSVEIWDTDDWTSDANEIIEVADVYDNSNTDGVTLGGLAGLAVGSNYIEPYITLVKTVDPNSCVSPGDTITYTVTWTNHSETETAIGVTLIDYLPDEVYYPQSDYSLDPNMNIIPPDPDYIAEEHAIGRDIDDIGPEESGSVTISVKVIERAEPGMTIENKAVLTSSFGTVVETLETDVCCWDTGSVIYVDHRAEGNDNGISWEDAYVDLQQALERARVSGCAASYEIWVAGGSYNPGYDELDSFEIPDGVGMYGGFKGDEVYRYERNPDKHETILTAENGANPNLTVVTMGNDSKLDGFTVTQAVVYGVFGEDAGFTLGNCIIENNSEYGVYAENGDIVNMWCRIRENGADGVYHVGAGRSLTIENSQIVDNGQHGIYTHGSTPTIKNCSIAKNGSDDIFYKGIRIELPTNTPILYSNTIAYNANEGVSWVDDFGSGVDPNVLDYPDIQNCILWYNNDGGVQLAGYEFTQYSCVYDPNDSTGTDYMTDAFGNFSGNPGFAYEYSDDPNVLLNVHLAYDSPCIDMGDPNHDTNDVGSYDMDAEDRIVDSRVDIGADEVYSCDYDLSEDDIYHSLDWTADGIVNFKEYGIFLAAWLSVDPNNPLCDPNNSGYVSDPNDPGFISEGDKLRYSWRCDIDEDLDVDMADLALFCDEWLWIACWKQSRMDSSTIMMMGMGAGAQSASVMTREPLVIEAAAATPWSPEWLMAMGESEQVSIVRGIYAVLDYVDAMLQEKPLNTEPLYELQTFLLECLEDIKAARKEELGLSSSQMYNTFK